MSVQATYYTITDEAFFPGTVGLLNSLRLTGNEGEFVVLDCGLAPSQRQRLEPHCRIEPAQRHLGYRGNPLKPSAWRPREDSTVVMIDSDVLVTAALAPILRDAERGLIAAFVDLLALLRDPPNRAFREWEETLDLAKPLRPQPYLNSGLIAFSVAAWPRLVDRWREACDVAARAAERDRHRRLAWPENPFAFTEQDALNALLMSEVPAEAIAAYDYALAPITQWQSVGIRDTSRLRCVNYGRETLLLHHTSRPKAWERRGWLPGSYRAFADLLPRVLFAEDVPLRLDPADVPPWLRSGIRGGAVRFGAGSVRRALRLGSAVVASGSRTGGRSQVKRCSAP